MIKHWSSLELAHNHALISKLICYLQICSPISAHSTICNRIIFMHVMATCYISYLINYYYYQLLWLCIRLLYTYRIVILAKVSMCIWYSAMHNNSICSCRQSARLHTMRIFARERLHVIKTRYEHKLILVLKFRFNVYSAKRESIIWAIVYSHINWISIHARNTRSCVKST